MDGLRPRLQLGMVGGGTGAFIGAIHRMAAALDGDWRLTCGAFAGDPERSRQAGCDLGIAAERAYPSFDAMLAGEAHRPANDRMDAIAIVTPNHLHAPMSIAALEAGFHVLCEKPLALNLAQAEAIAAAVNRSGRQYALAFTYAGYPLVEEARLRIARGDLGQVRLVQVEYLQGWLSRSIDNEGNKQAEWRTDPARAGPGGCLGDIGTHAFQLAEHVSGLRVGSLSAELTTHVPGRRLDDDVSALLRFEGGATGVLKASQVAAGDENGLRLRIHGELGNLDWCQMEPNSLTLRWLDQPVQIVRTGGPGLSPEALARTRTPAGHPEGYIEAFANIYRAFAHGIRTGYSPRIGEAFWFPGLTDGLRTMAFIQTMLENAGSDRKWSVLQDPKA